MIGPDIVRDLGLQLGVEIHKVTPVSGGDINLAYRLKTAKSEFFLKANTEVFAEDMFAAEAAGLRLLRSAGWVS